MSFVVKLQGLSGSGKSFFLKGDLKYQKMAKEIETEEDMEL